MLLAIADIMQHPVRILLVEFCYDCLLCGHAKVGRVYWYGVLDDGELEHGGGGGDDAEPTDRGIVIDAAGAAASPKTMTATPQNVCAPCSLLPSWTMVHH